MSVEKIIKENKLELVQTCGACPEQYDVFNEHKEKIGYIRLRHGTLRVDYPWCGEETIYYTTDVKGDGVFDDEEEREKYLKKCLKKILKKEKMKNV